MLKKEVSKMRFPISKRRQEPLLAEFDFGRIFDDFLKYPLKLGLGQEAVPAVDVYEKDNKAVADIELPGADPKNIKLSVDGNILMVSGERKKERETKKEGYYRLESVYGRFERNIELPFDVRTEGAKAAYKKGVLRVELPKSETQRRKDIRIDIN